MHFFTFLLLLISCASGQIRGFPLDTSDCDVICADRLRYSSKELHDTCQAECRSFAKEDLNAIIRECHLACDDNFNDQGGNNPCFIKCDAHYMDGQNEFKLDPTREISSIQIGLETMEAEGKKEGFTTTHEDLVISPTDGLAKTTITDYKLEYYEGDSKLQNSSVIELCIFYMNLLAIVLFSAQFITIIYRFNAASLQYIVEQSEEREMVREAARRGAQQNNGSQVKKYESCIIPNYPPHTEYAVTGDFGESFNAGNHVNNFKVLRITCDRGYKISPIGSNYSICVNGTWNPTPSSCLRSCPSLVPTHSTQVHCKYEKTPLENCNNPVEGTIAVLSCNLWFEEASIDRYPVRHCLGGRWNFAIPQCYPACGLTRPPGPSNIIHGRETKSVGYPWNVGIYNTKREFICSGSIIDQHAVLSAAHCFTSDDGSIKPSKNFFLAAGKYFRKYNDDRDKHVQYSRISRIYIPETYKGRSNFYTSDIAILILTKPFTISSTVQPVCIDLKEESSDFDLSLNTSGIVTGWGYTEEGNKVSDELKEILVYYETLNKCYQEVSDHLINYIATDKICGRYKNNETLVCEGVVGGGLAFKNRVTNRCYVNSIVTTSPSTDAQICFSNQYQTYTLVSRHVVFVREALAHNRVQKPVLCEDDCNNEEPESVSSLENITASFGTSHIPAHPSKFCYSESAHTENSFGDECGSISNPLVQHITVNGTTVEKSQFPWLVSIRHRFNNGQSEFICTGNLVSNKYVITAAHCIREQTPLYATESLLVILGNTDIEAWDNDYIISEVRNVSVHPDYDWAKGYSDIAVFTLDIEVVFTNFIKPICTWNEDNDVNLIIGCKGTVAGWCSSKGRETIVPEAINFEIPIVSNMECPLPNGNFMESRSFCAGNGNERGFCTENSGAGFAMLRNGRWTLRGVASRIPSNSAPTCDIDKYFVFADIAQVRNWLDKVLI